MSKRMRSSGRRPAGYCFLFGGTLAIAVGTAFAAFAAEAPNTSVARGAYISLLANCEHCHTPGHFLGKRDDSRKLSGSDVGFWIEGIGTFVGPNITPDNETGIGSWSRDEIKTALTTGERPDGRMLSPVMPWADLAQLEDSDLDALVDYLKSLKPLRSPRLGPFGPTERLPVFSLRLVSPETARSDRLDVSR